MRRRAVVVGVALVAAVLTASAQGAPPSANASCVATITSYEATRLPSGSVGAEVSGLATSGPGLGRTLVSGLAKEHAGSLAECAAAEGL